MSKDDKMEKIFLEGDSFIGKSTLLRKCLEKEDISVAGFYVERRLNSMKEIIGFELKNVKELMWKKTSFPIDSNCFIWSEKGKKIRRLEVFETFGVQLLEEAINSSTDIILLDEIGGIELLSARFYQNLLALIQQPRKIIGVYKSENNYQRQKKMAVEKFNIDVQREHLRNQICQNKGKIVELTEENSVYVENMLSQILK